MSQLFVTSDVHAGHKNIIKYESRPFLDTDEMDNEIIRRWNKKVGPDDRVIMLGDFCLRNVDHYLRMLARLNYGSMLWIKGNHDKGIKTLNEFPRVFAVKNAIIEVPGIGLVYLNHEPFVSPVQPVEMVIHGHVHGREGSDVIRVRDNVMFFHAGMDTNNLRPWHINEIVRAVKRYGKHS